MGILCRSESGLMLRWAHWISSWSVTWLIIQCFLGRMFGFTSVWGLTILCVVQSLSCPVCSRNRWSSHVVSRSSFESYLDASAHWVLERTPFCRVVSRKLCSSTLLLACPTVITQSLPTRRPSLSFHTDLSCSLQMYQRCAYCYLGSLCFH